MNKITGPTRPPRRAVGICKRKRGSKEKQKEEEEEEEDLAS